MLSDRITALFTLLQCSNTEIARYAGCTPSAISRLKSGARCPAPASRPVQRLTDGVLRYAEAEELLDVLARLCGADVRQPESPAAALTAWLFGERPYTLPEAVPPKRIRERDAQRRRFGSRLDRVMRLLELSNVRLAGQINVDASLISRCRSGLCSPTEGIRDRLSERLVALAAQADRAGALAALCGTKALTAAALTAWLSGTGDDLPPRPSSGT